MISEADFKDMDMIIKVGMEALNEKLGPLGTIEFLHHIEYGHKGYGDYTKERHKWLDKLTMEDIVNGIKEMKMK
ncbi:MAG: hypothetical protein LBL39_00995 [Planctomycetaceae bacterium]|jgi:hypothetical protein|nr:hypothetical protein [Planctomycetaceae bacterium]